MKKTRKMAILILLVAALVTSSLTNVFAANVCKVIGGTAKSTVTFTVKTDKTWLTSNKVKLTQAAKGTAKGKIWSSGRTKTYKIYGYYNVYVTDSKGKTKVTTWKDKNITISGLKKNSKYTIKVVPYKNGDISATWAGLTNGGFYGWSKTPSWSVKKTSGITLCK